MPPLCVRAGRPYQLGSRLCLRGEVARRASNGWRGHSYRTRRTRRDELPHSTHPSSSSLLATGAAAFQFCDPYLAANAVSGMETALSTFAFAFFLYLLWHALSPGSKSLRLATLGTGVAATVVPMLRPEMALAVALLFSVILLLHRESRSAVLVAFVTFLVLGGAYYAARYSYYGLPFPLPFYIKQRDGLYALGYFWQYEKHARFLTVFALAGVVAALMMRKARPKALLCLVLALAATVGIQLAYYGSIRPIMGLGFRYFQPISPGLVVLAFIGLSEVVRLIAPALPGGAKTRASALTVVLVLAASWNLSSYGAAKAELLDQYVVLEQNVIRVAFAMRDAAAGAPLTVAMNDCGAAPFYTGFDTVDLAGLNDRAIAVGRSTEATVARLTIRQPDVVILISTGSHPSTIRGWERLSDQDVRQLGYTYSGAVAVDTEYQNIIYTRGERAEQFAANLRASGAMR